MHTLSPPDDQALVRPPVDRIVVLFAELRRLTQRETEVRREIAELLEQPRSPAADAALGKLLRGLAEARQ